MRRSLLAALLFSCVRLTVPAFAADAPEQAATPVFAEVAVFGTALSQAEVVPVSKLYAEPDAYVGKPVKVEGRVVSVCAKRGCWMELAGDQEFQSMRIKVEDGVIVFPMDAVGHVAVAEGVFTKIELSMEQTHAMEKHRCEEAGEEYDPSKTCTPASIYQIAGVAAEIR